MPGYSPTYPPSAPSVSGSNITVDRFLNNPAIVQRAIFNLTNQRFISDIVFAQGPQASGGAVQYDQLTEGQSPYLDRDVQEIAPGGEFPILTDTAPTPKMAAVRKWGGRVPITYESRDRNAWDVVGRTLTKLSNTIIRKVDTVAMAALNAAPTLSHVGVDWSDPATNIFADIAAAQLLVDALEMGYVIDTAIIHPNESFQLDTREDVRDAMSETTAESMVRGASVGRIRGVDFYSTYRQTPGTAHFLARKIVGSISDEVPLRTRTYEEEREETYYVQGSRRLVPYVTDPKACVVATGLAG